MFYQACKVAGKNSTQCNEKKVDGTMIIEIDFKPETDMTITCDCVGILKERNVDVEHRFPDHLAQKSKKKSTRCRMVFRTQLSFDDGTVETLQVCSNQIICTQPPGVPEIYTRYMDTSVVQPCSSNAAANAAVVQQMWNETKHEIDADMMPPPTSTQIPVNMRRSSLTNAMITDQIVQINGLKTEIIDENSQNSIADAMQSDSLDRFPVVANDNGLVTDSNPLKEVMQYQRMRKQSIDMLDMRSMSLLNESNSLPSFPTHHNDMNAVEIAVKNEQIAKEILTVAAVHQGQHTVDKFLSSLHPAMKSGPPMEPNSMFVSSTGGSSGVLFPAQATNNMVVASNPTNSIDQTFSNILAAAASHSPPSDMQSIPLVRTSSVSSTASSSSSSSSGSNKSPGTHDIILNSEPAAAITSVNMQQMLTGDEPTATADHLPAEMILNSNVSPTTILCPPNAVSNLMAEQVSLLNGMRMPQQATQDSILNTIIMTPPSNSSPTQQQSAVQSQQQVQQQTSPRQASAVVQRQDSQVTATSTAVSNMIIKAAADFISNHENNPESTISALMGLNTSPIQTQSQVSQMLASPVTTNSLVPNASAGLCPTTQFLANNTRHHQMMEQRQQETVPLVNILLNHDVQNVTGPAGSANVQSQFLQSLQKSSQMALNVAPQTNQESLIQAVALAETALQKSNASVAQQQLNNILPPNVSLTDPPTTVPIPSAAATIPQEITTMSDQDLISYINPSTFDHL